VKLKLYPPNTAIFFLSMLEFRVRAPTLDMVPATNCELTGGDFEA
jgi:hypothetical protein